MKSLITRTITAVFFVVALVGCMIWSEYSFALFFALVAGMGVWEFSANVNRHAGASVNAFISTAGAIALVFAVSQCSSSTPNYASFLPFVGTLLYILISELYRRESNPLKNWGFAFAAQLYIALPLSLLSFLAYRYNAELQYVRYDWFLPLSIFFFLWSLPRRFGFESIFPCQTLPPHFSRKIMGRQHWWWSAHPHRGSRVVAFPSRITQPPPMARSWSGGLRVWHLG